MQCFWLCSSVSVLCNIKEKLALHTIVNRNFYKHMPWYYPSLSSFLHFSAELIQLMSFIDRLVRVCSDSSTSVAPLVCQFASLSRCISCDGPHWSVLFCDLVLFLPRRIMMAIQILHPCPFFMTPSSLPANCTLILLNTCWSHSTSFSFTATNFRRTAPLSFASENPKFEAPPPPVNTKMKCGGIPGIYHDSV